jgi:type II secretory pathway pseudopilin PulG
MEILRSSKAFTLTELMAVFLIMGVILTAGSMVFISGQNLFATASAQSELQANASRALQRIARELGESGRDSGHNLMVSVLDNAGVGGSDILYLAVPLCTCGTAVMDTNGDVNHWGAPLSWGQSGCGSDYTLDANGKVTICHLPPGNPGNPLTLSVSPNAIKAHLAHGDHLGPCGQCDPSVYANKAIEYSMDADQQLLRKVLDENDNVLNSAVMARQMTGFQAAIDLAEDKVTLTVQMSGKGGQGRILTVTNATSVLLRNR